MNTQWAAAAGLMIWPNITLREDYQKLLKHKSCKKKIIIFSIILITIIVFVPLGHYCTIDAKSEVFHSLLQSEKAASQHVQKLLHIFYSWARNDSQNLEKKLNMA